MDRGVFPETIQTTGPNQTSEIFLAQAMRALAEELELDVSKLITSGMAIRSTHQLASEHNPDILSDNFLNLIWYGGKPVAMTLETRNEYNNVRMQPVYFGWKEPSK